MSGLISLPDIKSFFSKFSAPVPSGQIGDTIKFSSVEDSIDALVILNNRFVFLFLTWEISNFVLINSSWRT